MICFFSRKTDSDVAKVNPGPEKKLKVDEGKGKGTRPRKDRLAKAENKRSVFVGNLSVKTTKKVKTVNKKPILLDKIGSNY